jgi:type II secretory pathway pseudopilin PulG
MNLKRQVMRALNCPEGRTVAASRAFTLIELVLVMGILITVLSVSATSLSKFFRGRLVDNEARRFLALTRYAQSRAVAEGVPMQLWIDEKSRAYGLQMQPGYADSDDKARGYQLGTDLTIEPGQPPVASAFANPVTGNGNAGPSQAMQLSGSGSLPAIQFTPDGFISLTSPESVAIHDGERETIIIAQSQNRLLYEIQTNNPANNSR